MATADEYAAWIVKNQDKKGSPEFDIVAKAYTEAKTEAPAPTKGLQTFESTGGGAAVGNPTMKAQRPSMPLTDVPYEAGGAVTDVLAKVLPAEVAAAGGYLTNVGIQAVPALLGGGVAKGAAPVMEGTARGLMQSAVKPILSDLKSGKAARTITTLLEEGLNATKGGMAKLRLEIDDLNREIADKIKNSTADFDKYAVWNAVKQKLDQFTRQAAQSGDTAKIQEVWHDFLSNPLINGDRIPVQLAQELKQGTYQQLNKKYGQLASADYEAQKAVGRGLKDEIGKVVPDVVGLNAREGELINALKVTERKVLLDANKNPGGLAWLAHNPKTWALFMADKSALFKSLAAHLAYKGRERIPEAITGLGIAGTEAATNYQGE